MTMRQSYSSGRAAAGRVSWGLADQALSSLTNFGLVVLVARSVQPAEFGAFSVVYAMFALALGAARAIAGEPLLIAHSATTVERWRWGVAGACGAALLTGALAGLGCIVAGLFARVVVEVGGSGGPARQRRRHGKLARVGAFAIDPALVDDDAARLHQHVGVGDEPDQPRRAPAQLVQRQVAVALLLGLDQREERRRLRPLV